MSQKMGAAGADALLVVTPCFYKGGMTNSALEAHFTKVAMTFSLSDTHDNNITYTFFVLKIIMCCKVSCLKRNMFLIYPLYIRISRQCACVRTCVLAYVRTCVRARARARARVLVRVCVRVCVRACVCVRVCMRWYAHRRFCMGEDCWPNYLKKSWLYVGLTKWVCSRFDQQLWLCSWCILSVCLRWLMKVQCRWLSTACQPTRG